VFFLQAEIIHSVVYGSDKLTVDGSRIQPNVPSMLLNECQEEIYEVCVLVFSLHDFFPRRLVGRASSFALHCCGADLVGLCCSKSIIFSCFKSIGTSLYFGGSINVASLISLCNLSLSLIEDKLHEGAKMQS